MSALNAEKNIEEIALVTGGSRGIGRAIALKLAEDGYHIWLNYRSSDSEAEAVQSLIEEQGGKCTLMRCDVSNREAVRETLLQASEALNSDEAFVSVVVNNAGIVRDNIFYWMTEEEWDGVINTNLNSFFHVTKCFLKNMIHHKKGCIVNISSISGLIGNYGQANYSAAKAGLIAATKTLAKELGKNNIRSNAVIPGIIETEMAEVIKDSKKMLKMIPLHRVGQPEEIAEAVSFVCSDRASYITGAVLPVTGGLYS